MLVCYVLAFGGVLGQVVEFPGFFAKRGAGLVAGDGGPSVSVVTAVAGLFVVLLGMSGGGVGVLQAGGKTGAGWLGCGLAVAFGGYGQAGEVKDGGQQVGYMLVLGSQAAAGL